MKGKQRGVRSMDFASAISTTIDVSRLLNHFAKDTASLSLVKDLLNEDTRAVFLSTDVLTKMLSYVSISDVYNMIRVCKAWHACMEKPEFWTRHVRWRVQEALKHDKQFSEDDRRMIINEFHPFKWTDISMQTRLEWLFRQNDSSFRIQIEWSVDFLVVSLNISPKTTSYGLSMEFKRQTVCDKLWPQSMFNGIFTRENGKWVNHGPSVMTFYSTPFNKWLDFGIRHMEYARDVCQSCVGSYRLLNGYQFEGECDVNTCKPHGKGKWTFPDGTTLTGDKVAYDGEPHGVGQDDEAEWFAGERLEKKRLKRG